FGIECLQSIASNCGLAEVYSLQGRYAEAIPLFEKLLEITAENPDGNPCVRANVSYGLGSVYLSMRKLDPAVLQIRQAEGAYRTVLGDSHWHVAQTTSLLARYYHYSERPDA